MKGQSYTHTVLSSMICKDLVHIPFMFNLRRIPSAGPWAPDTMHHLSGIIYHFEFGDFTVRYLSPLTLRDYLSKL